MKNYFYEFRLKNKQKENCPVKLLKGAILTKDKAIELFDLLKLNKYVTIYEPHQNEVLYINLMTKKEAKNFRVMQVYKNITIEQFKKDYIFNQYPKSF